MIFVIFRASTKNKQIENLCFSGPETCTLKPKHQHQPAALALKGTAARYIRNFKKINLFTQLTNYLVKSSNLPRPEGAAYFNPGATPRAMPTLE